VGVDLQQLKKGGLLKQVQKEFFSLRLHIVGGQLTFNQLQMIAQVSKDFGNGEIHLTARQGVEIPFIKLQDFETIKNKLAQVGLEPGACGPRVRTVTACQGCKICPNGLIETKEFSKKIDEKFFGRDLKCKFKISISGCLNNCLKAEENDLGIKGCMEPEWLQANCIFCGLCEAICPVDAIKINYENRDVIFNPQKCIKCGRCVTSCSSDAWKGREGYLLLFGGRNGNVITRGKQVVPVIYKEEKVLSVIEHTLKFIADYGNNEERFADILQRVGNSQLQKYLKEVLESE